MEEIRKIIEALKLTENIDKISMINIGYEPHFLSDNGLGKSVLEPYLRIVFKDGTEVVDSFGG